MSENFSGDPVRPQSLWVLKGTTREFYVCTTAGSCGWRTALCVFDSGANAGEYLRSLGEARAFVEIMQRHGMPVPDWMLQEPELPEAHETTAPELCRVAEGIGVEWVAVNPPPIEVPPDLQKADVLALVGVEDLGVPPYHTGLPDTTVQLEEGEVN